MKRIYFFMLLSVWIFAACSSTSRTVKADAPIETSASKGSDEVFHHPGAGFSMIKPMGWSYLSPEMTLIARQSVKLDDQKLKKMIEENPNAPLVVITRYREPYPTLNPSVSVRVTRIPVEGIPPKDILHMLMGGVKRMFPDLTYVDEVQNVHVDGLNGAYTKIKYTVFAGDQKFPTLVRMWLIPRGKIVFTIDMSSPQEGPDISEKTFKKILSSIKIEQK